MASTSGAAAGAAEESKELTAGTRRKEVLVKIHLDGRGWDYMKHIDFEISVFKESKLAKGRFMVNEYSSQPFGVLGAGTTFFVCEATGSLLTAWASKQRIAGVEINVHHLRPVPIGYEILLTAKPLLWGTRLLVWEVRFETEKPKPPGSDSITPELVLVASGRVTIMIIPTEKEFAPVKVAGIHDKFAGMTFIETLVET